MVAVMAGKLSGGIFAIFLAYHLSAPKALELEKPAAEAAQALVCEKKSPGTE
jgi:ethanolamine transporter EutH